MTKKLINNTLDELTKLLSFFETDFVIMSVDLEGTQHLTVKDLGNLVPLQS